MTTAQRIACLFVCLLTSLASAQVTTNDQGELHLQHPLGHSHNDYYQNRPLTLALHADMLSIEADVFVRDNDLFVAHDEEDIKPQRTLKRLYLDPLYRRFQQQGGPQPDHPFGGSVRPSSTPVLLMIDFKSAGPETWVVLEHQLSNYPGLIRRIDTDNQGQATITPGPVIVAISGNRPIDMMTNASTRYSGIDGRFPADLDSNRPAHLMPMISCSFSTLRRAAGTSDPEKLKPLLQRFANATAEDGRLARVWATPDTRDTWSLLFNAGMQLINTDQPQTLTRAIHQLAQQPSN